MSRLLSRLHHFYRRHYWYLVSLVLFVTFRLLALILLRPGGFIADNSDYEFYYAWGFTLPMGYTPFVDMWATYPPLFPALMLPIFELASRIPPWVEPRLFFHLLFGLELLAFEIGNYVLIYRLALRLEQPGPAAAGTGPAGVSAPGALRSALFYALLFVPAYTLLGWFEAMPTFFLLLGLDLLLSMRQGGWVASAMAAALGFLTKLTPVILVPVAVRWLGARLSLAAARGEWFRRGVPGNLLRPAIYALLFVGTVIAVGLPLAHFNPELALSSLRINAIRPPWQSVWALWDGYYGFGLVPIDVRNLKGFAAGDQWQTRLPWPLITLVFSLLYLWLYTRRYDWSKIRTPIAFTGVSLIWLLLYSKGWSPQFAVWMLIFVALLRPDMYGALMAVTLTVLNLLESYVYLLLVPDELWILVFNVVARTVLMILLAVEFLGQIWPHAEQGRRARVGAAWLAGAVMVAVVVGTFAGAPRAAQAYWDRRLAEHPCGEAVTHLQAGADGLTRTVATPQNELWQALYPWLRASYQVAIIEGYNADDRPAAAVVEEKLAQAATRGEFWWIEEGAEAAQGTWSPAAASFFARPNVYLADVQTLGDCLLARVILAPADETAATFDAGGATISLRQVNVGAARRGAALPVVLYWQSDAPVAGSYTVFVQLLDQSSSIVSQQDNLPVRGLAPTDTWHPGALIRDPYQLAVPPDIAPGLYQLQIGLYDADGRLPASLPDGARADHLTLSVEVK